MRQLSIAIQTRLPLTCARFLWSGYIRKHAQNGAVSVPRIAAGTTPAKSIRFLSGRNQLMKRASFPCVCLIVLLAILSVSPGRGQTGPVEAPAGFDGLTNG